MAKVKSTARQAGRRWTLYFNRDARRSASDQLRKASWLLAVGAGALGLAKGSITFGAVVVIGWVVCQVLVTFILSIEDKCARAPAAKSRTPQCKQCAARQQPVQ